MVSSRTQAHVRAMFMAFVLLTFEGCQVSSNYLPSSTNDPTFIGQLQNITVIRGKDAVFHCAVDALSGYRVAWIKADTKAIQAIHDHLVTHNSRVSVQHKDKTWTLAIKNVQEQDRGPYMCQINTDPMQSQVSFLEVLVPPDIVESESSSDVMLSEGGSTVMLCRAKGHPPPEISWRREDNLPILVTDGNGRKDKTLVHKGHHLVLSKVTRSDMGTYLCVASNGVSPSVSKTIKVSVHFPPSVIVPIQVVGAPLNAEVVLECVVQASPRPLNYWTSGEGRMMVTENGKYAVGERVNPHAPFEVVMTLTISKMRKEDFGKYKCNSKNSLGEADGNVDVHRVGIEIEETNNYEDEEDYSDGSSDRQEIESELDNDVDGYDRPRQRQGSTNNRQQWPPGMTLPPGDSDTTRVVMPTINVFNELQRVAKSSLSGGSGHIKSFSSFSTFIIMANIIVAFSVFLDKFEYVLQMV